VVPVHHYVIEPSMNTLPGAGADPDAAAAAARIADELGESETVAEWLRRDPGDRFDSLNELMDSAGIDAVVASSPVNVQELSGIPALQLGGEVYAIYLRSSRRVHVFSRRELAWFGLPEPGAATAETIRGVLGGARTGVEEEDLTQEAFDGLGLSDLLTAQASVLLRRWRELRTWVDLEYYLIGSNTTIKAIDSALALVSAAATGDSPATELDAFRRYREVVATEIDRANRSVRVRPYFTHTHAGNRSHIPASATNHVLRPLTTLKIDAGLEVYDRQGYLRANSDIARSAVGDDAARDFYLTLDHGLTDVLIDACRPGRTGEQLFAAATDWLETHRSALVAAGFAPPIDATFPEMIGRDVGHLLGKQEPATVIMAKGNTWELRPGMVAAAEFQWPIGDYCFGVEDCFMTTEGEPLNLTRRRGQRAAI
jgi:Xaa-Pro aminopeptidase